MGFPRTVVSLLSLPHELVHFLLFAPWREDLTIVLSPPVDETSGVPLARIGGTVSTDIPEVAVRLAAIGPVLVFPMIALGVRLLVGGLNGIVAIPIILLLAFWGVPSSGDINIALRPEVIADTGSFETKGSTHPKATTISTILTVLVTWLTAAILLL